MAKPVITKEFLRRVLRYEFDKGSTAAEAAENICSTYGEGVIGKTMAFKYYVCFRKGDSATKDAPRSGRPVKFDKKHLQTLLERNNRQTTRELAKKMKCDHSTVVRHLQKMRKAQKLDTHEPLLKINGRMRCCIACGKSIVRGASLPVNPLRRRQFLENLCLTKYSEFIAHKCFLCFEHFNPEDVLEVNGEKKLRHCQVTPIELSVALPNPKFEQKVNKLASARLAWSESRNNEDMSEDNEDEDEEESEIKTEDDKEYIPNSSRSKQSSSKQQKTPSQAERLEAIRAAKFKGMRQSNSTTPVLSAQPENGPEGRSLKLDGYPLHRKISNDRLILNINVSQCFLCSKVISNGAKIPQNSYYRSIWREGLQLNGYLPKTGMICFQHFRLDDQVFDSSGVACNVKLGVAPVFNNLTEKHKTVMESIPQTIAKEAMERRKVDTLQTPTSVGTSRKRKDSSNAPEEEKNDEDNATAMQKIAENAEKRKRVLQQGLCGSVIKTLKQVNLDQPEPGKQSTCELGELSNTRYYEPHCRPEDEVYCLSQVTQIGEKICAIENKFTQLMELVTEFVMAKTNAAAANPVQPISREQYKERQQMMSMEMKRKALAEQKRQSKRARRLANNNKWLEEKRKKREEQKRHQPFLLYNSIKIYYPTSIRNKSTVCKVCFAAFENTMLLADHLYNQDDLSGEYYKCLVCDVNVFYLSEMHVLEAHGPGQGTRYALHDDLPIKTQETLKSYAEKMFGDQGNVIGLDSDSDGQPSSFFEATAKKVKMDRNPGARGGITANVVVRESDGPGSAMQIVQSLFASSNATPIEASKQQDKCSQKNDGTSVGAGSNEDILEKNAEAMASNELLDELLSEAKEKEKSSA